MILVKFSYIFFLQYAVAVIIVGLIEIVGAILAFVFTASIVSVITQYFLTIIIKLRINFELFCLLDATHNYISFNLL